MRAARVGRLALAFGGGWLWRWLGPAVNSPYLWQLYLGPLFLGWLRVNWDRPIVLPRQARRALARGKRVHIRGYLRVLAFLALAGAAEAGEIVKRGTPWNECRVPGTRTFTFLCDDAGVARPIPPEQQRLAAALAGWVQLPLARPEPPREDIGLELRLMNERYWWNRTTRWWIR